ncbi:hypothetical protein ACIOEX_20065 [Streptomyces sp. NPDC087850]|uniref:hypothetical protein n=1 Tax=Streptomyces sp. NPDC087850 TaxID=3365809 RepID=UPI0038040F52
MTLSDNPTPQVDPTSVRAPTAGTAAPPSDQPDSADKWKALSRENERKWKQTSKELEDLQAAQLTDQEKALEAAKEYGRKAAFSELAPKLTTAEIRVQAAKAGVSASLDYLDLNHFMGEDGQPDSEKVKAYIATLAPPAPQFAQLATLGQHQPASTGITTMDPTELADLIAGGTFI